MTKPNPRCGSKGIDANGRCLRCGLEALDDVNCPPGFLTPIKRKKTMPRHATPARNRALRLQDAAKTYAQAHAALEAFQALPVEQKRGIDAIATQIALQWESDECRDALLALAQTFK